MESAMAGLSTYGGKEKKRVALGMSQRGVPGILEQCLPLSITYGGLARSMAKDLSPKTVPLAALLALVLR
jgi:hypothetical protein